MGKSDEREHHQPSIMLGLPTSVLGRTGLEVTRLGYGALELRGMVAGVGRTLSQDEPGKILNAALDAGINYIDVAVDYGEAEEHIGSNISHRRSEFYLASKCGCPLDNAMFCPDERTRYGVPLPRLHDYSRDSIVNACNQSLRRMRTDYLDIVQLHFSPARELLEQEGAIETLQGLQREGKVRYIGCSSILPNIMDHIEMGVFDVLQVPYSILQPEHAEAIACRGRGGHRRSHPRRCGPGRAGKGPGSRPGMGFMGESGPWRPSTRYDGHRVHASRNHLQSKRAHRDRGHPQPGSPIGE